jgi:O-antigen ligase
VGYLTLFCLILVLVRGRRRLYAFASVLVLAALGQAMFASMLALSGGRLWAGAAESYAHGSFPNRNHLAGFLAMSIALGIGLLMAGLDPDGGGLSWRQRLRNLTRTLLGHKARLRIYLAIMVVTLVLTGSRMGNTAFFASLLGASLLALLFYRRLPRSALVLLVSLVLVDLFILGSWFGLDRVRERLERTVLTQEERYHVDVHGLGYLDDFWVTGSGGGTFAVVFPAYRDQGLSPNFFAHAHNDYLESVLEYGVLGLVLPGAVVALSLGAALRVLHRRRDPLPRGMAFASLMGVMAILIHSTADFNLHIPANAALFVVLLALPWLGLEVGHRQSEHG